MIHGNLRTSRRVRTIAPKYSPVSPAQLHKRRVGIEVDDLGICTLVRDHNVDFNL